MPLSSDIRWSLRGCSHEKKKDRFAFEQRGNDCRAEPLFASISISGMKPDLLATYVIRTNGLDFIQPDPPLQVTLMLQYTFFWAGRKEEGKGGKETRE